jgi:hypothetical protein
MRLLHWTTTRIMDRYRGSCPIHEQLLAGLVLLPQHHILFPPHRWYSSQKRLYW